MTRNLIAAAFATVAVPVVLAAGAGACPLPGFAKLDQTAAQVSSPPTVRQASMCTHRRKRTNKPATMPSRRVKATRQREIVCATLTWFNSRSVSTCFWITRTIRAMRKAPTKTSSPTSMELAGCAVPSKALREITRNANAQ